jgi:hypothetical protein
VIILCRLCACVSKNNYCENCKDIILDFFSPKEIDINRDCPDIDLIPLIYTGDTAYKIFKQIQFHPNYIVNQYSKVLSGVNYQIIYTLDRKHLIVYICCWRERGKEYLFKFIIHNYKKPYPELIENWAIQGVANNEWLNCHEREVKSILALIRLRITDLVNE